MTRKAIRAGDSLRSPLTPRRSILVVVALALCATLITASLLRPPAQPFGRNYAACTVATKYRRSLAIESAPLFFVAGRRLTAPDMSPTQIERSVISWHPASQTLSAPEVTTPRLVTSGGIRATVLWTPSVDLKKNTLAYIQGSAIQVGQFGGEGDLVVSSADGRDRHVVLKYGDNNPVWSPDGSHIAYVYNGIVFIMNPNGSHQRELAGPGDVGTITWSPNGACIAASAGQSPGRIAVISVRTDEYAWLTPPNVPAYYPAWSPRANELAYEAASHSLMVENLSSGRIAQIASCPPVSCSQDLWPAWSPDGSLMAFVRSNGGPEQIFIVSGHGGSPRQVTFGPDQHTSPSW